MKKTLIIGAALMTAIGPLAATSAFADPPRHHDGRGHNDRGRDRDDRGRWRDDDGRRHHDDRGRWGDDDRRRHDGGYRRGDRPYDYDNRDDRRDERRAYRYGYHEGRQDQRYANRWDNRRYNGYYYRDRWAWGPPPVHYYHDRHYRPAYRSWRRGEYVPAYYLQRCRRIDHRRYHHLHAPPRDAYWVQDERGDFLLVGVATGLLLGVVLAGG